MWRWGGCWSISVFDWAICMIDMTIAFTFSLKMETKSLTFMLKPRIIWTLNHQLANIILTMSTYLWLKLSGLSSIKIFPDVKLREKYKKQNRVSCDEISKCWGKFAVLLKQELNAMNKNCHELNHLQVCHVSLPPNILLIFWSQRSHHVVEIHEKVYKSVAKAKKCCMTTRYPSCSRPNTHW